MRRATVIGAGVFAGALLAGCEPEKQLPKVVTAATEKTKPALPTASHPDAVKVVERCLKAATDGHPERIDKLKVSRAEMKGTMASDAGVPVPRTRTTEAVWPDRFFQADEYDEGGPVRLTIGLRRPAVWFRVRRNGTTIDTTPADTRGAEVVVGEEVVGRHWMGLLVPLADPGTAVYDAKKHPVAGQPDDDSLQAVVKGVGPVFTLRFDGRTGFLRQVQFTHPEFGAVFRKEFDLTDPRPFGGVMVPTRVVHRRNGHQVEEWTVGKWEFPDAIPDATFDPPAEKK